MKLKFADAKQSMLIEILIEIFKERYTDIDNAIKTDELLHTLLKSHKVLCNGASLRVALGYIRYHDMLQPGFIVSDVSAGYWLTYNNSEMNDYINKQLNRMSNQFQNVKLLHQRIRCAKKSPENQPKLF